MRLTVLGGGGFRVPLVFGALLADDGDPRVDELVLHDVDIDRLGVVGRALEQQAGAAGRTGHVRVRTTTDLDEALDATDFVFSAMRVGGLPGRVADERVALDAGCLGQETTGPGGIAYALRTVPVALDAAERIASRAPGAWCINFTNPAGLVTQAMQAVLGERVVGICDSPVGLGRRAAAAVGVEADARAFGYVGLNHLGWLRSVTVDGTDRLPSLLADPDALLRIEEGRLFGPDWLRELGAIPNEYLYYYYFTREALTAIRGSAQTRGEYLLRQQDAFYADALRAPLRTFELWNAARRQREETYMAEARTEDEHREESDLGGGYEGVALALMGAIARDERTALILNVRNGSAVPGLPSEAVVELPCEVDARGPRPLRAERLDGAMLGLAQQVKAVEEIAIAAARDRSPGLALKAFALHPLVDGVGTARTLLDGYRSRIPEVRAALEGAG